MVHSIGHGAFRCGKMVAALHPVNAMVIFWGAVVLAQRALKVQRAGAGVVERSGSSSSGP